MTPPQPGDDAIAKAVPRAPRVAASPAPGLSIAALVGLSAEEAAARLAADGPNELPSSKARGVGAIALEVVREPMFVLLIIAAGLYLLLGELSDALMLSFAVVAVMGITVVQERRTERALEALRDLSSPRALVIRGGERLRVAGGDVVRGDLVLLAEGDRVPADGLLRETTHLTVDESLLTGESVAVRKVATTRAEGLDAPGGEDTSSLFSGTLLTAGQGVIEILATGPRSEIGKIGHALAQTETAPTRIQTETSRLVRVLAAVGLGACVVAVVAFAVTRGGSANAWKQGFLAGVAMAMAILPEELPVILTVFLALGAWRLSQRKVLARRMPAVETLGATTVLCVDKTGTLTENHMTLRRLVTSTGDDVDLALLTEPLAEVFHDTLEHAILASKRDPFDPMERALHEAGDRFVKDTEHLHPAWSLVRAYPLSTALLAMTHVWREGEETTLTVATKGAPEAVAELCRLEPAARAKLDALVAGLGSQGLRVLGVAKGTVSPEAVPEDVHAFSLAWVGLLAFEDPLRPAVPAAVAECRAAGVRVVMITGDNAITAQHIASAAGLGSSEVVLTGPQLAALDDEALASVVGTVGVFARVAPDQKLRIVRAFKAAGELVAMTGDGVNDAPALRAAHIGVAMGGRGTDVAREAASLVLLDDDFASLVQAIALGRRIFDNLKRAIVFTLAVHVPIAGLSLLPVFFGRWPLLLLPVHIVFLELVIDPTCSLVFEAEAPESDVMQRPPRDANERLFSSQTSWLALAQGASVLAASFAAFFVARSRFDVDSARSLVFVTLVSGIVTILLVNRSWSRSALAMVTAPNAALRWVLLGTTIALFAAVLTGVGQRLFHFGPATLPALGLALLAGVASLAWFEIVKQVWIRRGRSVGSSNAAPRARTDVVK